MIADVLKTKPWDSPSTSIPKEIYLPKGMLGPEERRCLFWIARDFFKERGAIVDAGAFIGASAFCFASGLSNSSHRGSRVIHSFDYFRAIDDYVAQSLSTDLRPTAPTEDYLDIFEWQTAKYREMIAVYAGDFNLHQWSGAPIEVLFIDIAKTQQLNSHLVRQMFPCLIPNGLVIHQDYFHCWHPYIHITMEILRDHFEVVDPFVAWQSRVFRYSGGLSQSDLDEVASFKFSYEEKLKLLQQMARRETGSMRAMAEVICMWQMVLEKDWDRFFAEHRTFWQRWPHDSTELWARQLNEVLALAPTSEVERSVNSPRTHSPR